MKGMRKIKRGKGFRGAVSYAINREPGDEPGQIIGGNMSSKTVKKLSSEFGASRKLRPDIEKPVWHNALRLPEGEKVTPAKLVEIADDYMQRMGFTDLHQRLYVLHDDPDGQHVHIVASRVGLDGSIYLGRNENLESTRHIQALEKSHNLEITKGPTLKDCKVVMPGKKRETQRETEWGLANGKRPDRLELQDLIDDALQTPCTAPEFAERLALAGVIVLPNIAPTGTMNGFSFKLSESILKPLAGSKIGDDYKWSKLQERGVEYVKSRDAAQLTQLKEQFARDASQFAADQPGVTELTPGSGDRNGGDLGATTADQSGITGPASLDIDRDSGGAGTVDNNQPGLEELTGGHSTRDGDGPGTFNNDSGERAKGDSGIRTDLSSTTPDSGQPDIRTTETDKSFVGSDLSQLDRNRRHENDTRRDEQGVHHGSDENHEHNPSSQKNGDLSKVRMVETDHGVSDNSDSQRRPGPSWSDSISRFRKASAAKRRAAEQRDTTAIFSKIDRSRKSRDAKDLKSIDPTPYLESQGFTVKRSGRGLSAQINGDELYRLDQEEGRWVWCDTYGQRGGDTIDLIKDLQPGTKYTEAVFLLSGGASVQPVQPRPVAPPRTPPKLPRQGVIERHQGREYLFNRGISKDTLDHAEKTGMVQYIDNAVLFIGRDTAGKAQNVTRRAIDANDPIQKRDFRGSDKSYPAILPGDSTKVWIVEGGTDALALHDIAKRSNQLAPTVIISGGANVRSFFDNPEVKAIIEKADKITISGENEKNTEAQARADAGHMKQAEKVGEISRGEIQIWTPPAQDKDLAALNTRQQTPAEQNRLKYEELRQQQSTDQQKQDPDQDRSRGMSR